ncbi:MAG: heme-binding protein [Reyranella sp.]|nr:heme-binding protein [Reyranella sp.]
MSKLMLVQTNKIVEAALAKAREMKIKPLAVAVLDDAGHVKSLQREDAASMFRNDIAVGMGDEDEAACIAGIEAAGLVAG